MENWGWPKDEGWKSAHCRAICHSSLPVQISIWTSAVHSNLHWGFFGLGGLFVCGCFVFSKCFVGVVLGFLTSLICSKIVLFSGFLCFGVWKSLYIVSS